MADNGVLGVRDGSLQLYGRKAVMANHAALLYGACA